ncbi:hypothetical protein TcWFU_004836 [Taenia crassiceps]|uniref:Uncharacterized protein n=1 Tax=Taenia crassiceps TaxID=6207 RepID=A0ABR4QB74_9CEST
MSAVQTADVNKNKNKTKNKNKKKTKKKKKKGERKVESAVNLTTDRVEVGHLQTSLLLSFLPSLPPSFLPPFFPSFLPSFRPSTVRVSASSLLQERRSKLALCSVVEWKGNATWPLESDRAEVCGVDCVDGVDGVDGVGGVGGVGVTSSAGRRLQVGWEERSLH